MLKVLGDYARGIQAFLKMLREGRLKDLDKLTERGRILGLFQVTKFRDQAALLAGAPYEVGEPFHNILVNVGLAEIWNLVTAQGGTAFSNANARLGVGDSSAAVAVGQTDLQAASNKFRKAMDVTYPITPVNGAEVWRSTFASGEANYAWNEFAVFNAGSGGAMMNRSLSTQGAKAAGQSWQFTYTITLS